MYILKQIAIYFSTVLLLSNLDFTTALTCLDQNNNPVEWFVVYKLPKQKASANLLLRNGVAYTYMTSENYSNWILSDIGINDTRSLVSQSFNVFYNTTQKDEFLYIFYNDQPPYGESSEKKGHTKGVIFTDKMQGLWLIHSVPHFPYSLESYIYPVTGVHYGQSFLCISMNLTELDTIGLQLQYNEPHIFAQNVPQTFEVLAPELFKAANNVTIRSAPWYNVEQIVSLHGTKFSSFAKSGHFRKDLYSDLIGPVLESDLYVETWPNEPNRLLSECDKEFQVHNVLSVSIMAANISFTTTVDHSKWAVSPLNLQQWICIGDINRAKPQTFRGGGTTCINNGKLSNNYQTIVDNIQPCNKSLDKNYIT